MDINQYKGIVEGLLFVSGDEGVTKKQIAKAIELTPAMIDHIIESLQKDYEQESRGMMIMQSNEVFHLTTKPAHNTYYKKMLATPRATRMSQAMLETLSIIAYEQPITKIEIEEIRGVNSDYAIQTLLARSLIEKIGKKETIGRPVIYGTSTSFLTYFGLSTLEDLPILPEELENLPATEEMDLFLQMPHDNEKDS